MGFRRIKVSELTIPEHKYANPFRIVMLEFLHGNKLCYATSIEVITRDGNDMPWFCYDEFSIDLPQKRFEERMKESKVVENTSFEPEKEYSKWV
jgi:hypothetical protein